MCTPSQCISSTRYRYSHVFFFSQWFHKEKKEERTGLIYARSYVRVFRMTDSILLYARLSSLSHSPDATPTYFLSNRFGSYLRPFWRIMMRRPLIFYRIDSSRTQDLSNALCIDNGSILLSRRVLERKFWWRWGGQMRIEDDDGEAFS